MATWKQLSPSHYHTLGSAIAFGVTDVGGRATNQDNFIVAPELNLVAVADGMGGHEGGEIASAGALELLCSHLGGGPGGAPHDPDATWAGAPGGSPARLRNAIEYANAQLYAANAARHHTDGMGMGTTLTGLWQPVPHGPLHVFHVGDSRLYCWRGGTLHQLTRDQTLYQQAVDLGAPPPLPPRNLLLQALGPSPALQPDVATWLPAAGDVYLLCSDGLHGESAPEAIGAVLAQARPDNLDTCCAELVAMAKRDGSRDNITAVLLHYRG
ncbi:protein phosphatase 2C domain-containing protein [Massilia sp. METH4]|uniref:PP2C family protein-serine/threonine phosphatase n=1 Tax=Massilia sp. METH4 TaxID=3123041 RepID=UPI0030D58D8A